MATTTLPLIDEYSVIALFAVIWIFEKFFSTFLKASPLIGQIIAGIILGPPLLNVVPFPDAFRLLGKIGVMMLVLDSGLSVDLKQLKASGTRACIAATVGVVFPVALTMFVVMILWNDNWKVALSAGAALAPTSLGFSATLLSEVGQLESPAGQLICTAAVVDDVLSLLLLAEVQALQHSDISAWDIFKPILASIGSVGIGILLTFLFSPLLPKLRTVTSNETQRQILYNLTLLIYAASFAWGSAYVGSSDLIGCYLAGVAFSTEKDLSANWNRNTSQILRWGSALFFAATIGFGVPSFTSSGGLFEPTALLRALPLILVAIVGKFSVGFLSKPLNWVSFFKFGFGMGGRGEFSFLIADQAFVEGILNSVNYSAVIWALLVSSFLSPFGFRYFLKKEEKTPDTIQSPNLSF